MEKPRNNTAVMEPDNAVEDSFRRATFKLALSVRGMVEAAKALGSATRVPPVALDDIVYAMEMLDDLFLPRVTKAGENVSTEAPFTVEDIRIRLAHLARRILDAPAKDWSLPVQPKHGKMSWAARDCTECVAKATERCRTLSGEFMEKPHPERKTIAEQA